MATNIDLDKIIRSSNSPIEAMTSVDMLTGGKLSNDERINISQRILNSSKFKGGGSSSTSFTGGGLGGSSGSNPIEPPTSGGFIEKGLSAIGTGIKAAVGLVDGAVKLASKGVAIGLDTQMGKGNGDESLLSIAKTLGTQGMMGVVDLAKQGGANILDQLKEQSKLLSEVNTKTGISGELSDGIRNSMVMAQAEARRYGFELANIGEFYTTLTEQSGKFALINNKTIDSALPVAAAINMTLTEFANSLSEYERVGIGVKEATEAIGNVATKAVSLGLNANKVATSMNSSVGMLNQYGFKNGIQGLEKMVQKSIEFKVSMESVATIAEKVLNPEGAIDMAANLQVLGGAIGDFGDPIKMMYDATNNMEGLQDSLIKAAAGLATYNQEQKKFEITGINQRRAREMATALGISDYKQLANAAIAAQERISASTALMSTGLKMDDKEKEFLTNLSRMQDGEMKIVVPESIAEKLGVPTEIALDKLDQKTKDALVANQKEFEKNSPKDMAEKQLTETQKMVRGVEVMATWAKIQAANFVQGMGKSALSKEIQDLIKTIQDTPTKANPQRAEAEGVKVMEAIKNISLTDLSSMEKAYETAKKGLSTTFSGNQQTTTSTQQQQPQEIKQTINITSDVNSDYFNQVIKKDAAFGFEFKNPKSFEVLMPAKRKGK